jgi:hypothetical protein
MTECLDESTSARPYQAEFSVSADLIGRLYASSQHGLEQVVAPLSLEQRTAVALFCYSRAHLREIGLAVAAMCDQWSLVNAAGKLGEAIFAQSRLQPKASDRPAHVGRRKVTLATAVEAPGIVADIFDDEDEQVLELA